MEKLELWVSVRSALLNPPEQEIRLGTVSCLSRACTLLDRFDKVESKYSGMVLLGGRVKLNGATWATLIVE